MADRTVRSLLKDIQREVLEEADLLPARASELLNKSTALLGNCNDELRKADLEFKQILLDCLQKHETANRARIEAETSPQYVRRQEAQHTKELATEMIRSLRQFLRTAAEEMRLQR